MRSNGGVYRAKRRPFAVANWKMSMTVAESRAWLRAFRTLADDLLDGVDVLVLPPFTALWAIAPDLRRNGIQLGAQNMAATTDLASTGESSVALLADAGYQWVALGHREVRRHLGDDELAINSKVRLALESGLKPLVFVGEESGHEHALQDALTSQLERMLAGVEVARSSALAFVYEPESTIGAGAPAEGQHVASGCTWVRDWIGKTWGSTIADGVRIIYGGSVAPEDTQRLLSSPQVDGVGATRRARNPQTFAEIVRQIAKAKAL